MKYRSEYVPGSKLGSFLERYTADGWLVGNVWQEHRSDGEFRYLVLLVQPPAAVQPQQRMTAEPLVQPAPPGLKLHNS